MRIVHYLDPFTAVKTDRDSLQSSNVQKSVVVEVTDRQLVPVLLIKLNKPTCFWILTNSASISPEFQKSGAWKVVARWRQRLSHKISEFWNFCIGQHVIMLGFFLSLGSLSNFKLNSLSLYRNTVYFWFKRRPQLNLRSFR